MSQHTQGEWAAITERGSRARIVCSTTDGDGGCIDIADVFGSSQEECDANAWLMAAAPLLLQSLREMTLLVRVLPGSDTTVVAALVANAVAAMDAAKGGAS